MQMSPPFHLTDIERRPCVNICGPNSHGQPGLCTVYFLTVYLQPVRPSFVYNIPGLLIRIRIEFDRLDPDPDSGGRK